MSSQLADEHDNMEEGVEDDDGEELELAESLCVKMSGLRRLPVLAMEVRKFHIFFTQTMGVSSPLIQIPGPDEDSVFFRMKSMEERDKLMRKYRSFKSSKRGCILNNSRIILKIVADEDPRNYTGKRLEQLKLDEALDALYPYRHMPYHEQLVRKEAAAQVVIQMMFKDMPLKEKHNLKPNPMVPAYPLQGYDYDVFISLEEDAISRKTIAGIRAYAQGKTRIVPLDMCRNVPQQVAIISKHFIEHLPEIGLKAIDPRTAKGDIFGLGFRMNQYGKCILAIGLPKLGKYWIPMIDENGQMTREQTLRDGLENSFSNENKRRLDEIRRKLEGYFTKHGTQLGIESIFARSLGLYSVYKRPDRGLKNIHILGATHSHDVYNGYTYRLFGEKHFMAECFRSLMTVIEANTLLGPSTKVYLISQFIVAGLYLAKKCGHLTLCCFWHSRNIEEVRSWVTSSGVGNMALSPSGPNLCTDIEDSVVIVWKSHKPKLIRSFIDRGIRNFIFISYWDASKKQFVISQHAKVLALVNNCCRLQGIYAVDSKPNSHTFALAAFYTCNESPLGRPLGPPPENTLLQGTDNKAVDANVMVPQSVVDLKKAEKKWSRKWKKVNAKQKKMQLTQNQNTSPPAKSSAPLAKNIVAPANSSVPPTKTTPPPAKTTGTPGTFSASPAKTIIAPANTSVPPTKTIGTPAKITAPPTNTIAAPANSSVPPTKTTAPPTSTIALDWRRPISPTRNTLAKKAPSGPPPRPSSSKRRYKPSAFQMGHFASGAMKNLQVVTQEMQKLFPCNEVMAAPKELPPWSTKRKLGDSDDFTATKENPWTNRAPGSDFTERFGKRMKVDHSDNRRLGDRDDFTVTKENSWTNRTQGTDFTDRFGKRWKKEVHSEARGSGHSMSHWNSDEQPYGFGKRYDDPPSSLRTDSGDRAEGFVCDLLPKLGSALVQRSSIFGSDFTDRPTSFSELHSNVGIGMSYRSSSGLDDRPTTSSDPHPSSGNGLSGRSTNLGDLRVSLSSGISVRGVNLSDQNTKYGSCNDDLRAGLDSVSERSSVYNCNLGNRNPRYGASLGDSRDSLGSGIVDRSVSFSSGPDDQGRPERKINYGSQLRDSSCKDIGDKKKIYSRGPGDRDVGHGIGLDDRRPNVDSDRDYQSASYGRGLGKQVSDLEDRGGNYGRGLGDRGSGFDGRSDVYDAGFVDQVVDRDRTCGRSFDDGSAGYGSSLGDRVSNRDNSRSNYGRGFVDRGGSHGSGFGDHNTGYGRDMYDRDGNYGTSLGERGVNYGTNLGDRGGSYGTNLGERGVNYGTNLEDRGGNYGTNLGERGVNYGTNLGDRVGNYGTNLGEGAVNYGTNLGDGGGNYGTSLAERGVNYGTNLGVRDSSCGAGLGERGVNYGTNLGDRDGSCGTSLGDRSYNYGTGLGNRGGNYGSGLEDRGGSYGTVFGDVSYGRRHGDGNPRYGHGSDDRSTNWAESYDRRPREKASQNARRYN